jgi:MFS family permease
MSAEPVPVSAAPVARVSGLWTARFTLIWFGCWMANLVPVQLLLPAQLALIDPEGKVRDFAVVNGIAGLAALVADHSRSRFGKRRTPIAVGILVFAAGLVLAGQQQTVPLLVLWWAVSILGLSAMMAGLTAVVADRVPEEQRGVISSAIYGPQALGVVVGLAAVITFGLTITGSYALLAVALIVLALPFLLRYREQAAGMQPALYLRAVGRSLMVDPRRHPDFAWAFAGRLFVTLSNALGTCYMLYFLTDHVRAADPEATLLGLTMAYLAAGVVTSVVVGPWSDRTGRRRPFAAVAALAQAVSGLLLTTATGDGPLFMASVLMGGGWAAYMTVNQAVVTRVLPDADSRATDLGLTNIGLLVPSAVAPLIASTVVTSGGSGYPLLFLITGLTAAAGGVTAYLVRSVR